jgi:DNA (cytosine-5)-methyltransferase 1
MRRSFQVVDLFAGPGGLAEGFSGYEDASGERPFLVTLSVEREPAAHRTLQLRAFLRQFDEFPEEYYDALNSKSDLPDWSERYGGEWATAVSEALQLTLGTPEASEVLDARIDALNRLGCETVVIGGPPCQAYSLVGRARNRGVTGYVAEDDSRHYLYKEYIRILNRLKPVAFVMENVKGMLSSSLDGGKIFDLIIEDLRSAGGSENSYELFALSTSALTGNSLNRVRRSSDFIVKAEEFGVPQARHRVIIIGIKQDLAPPSGSLVVPGAKPTAATLGDVLAKMPHLRSRLSRGDSPTAWREAVLVQSERALSALREMPTADPALINQVGVEAQAFLARISVPPTSSTVKAGWGDKCPEELKAWMDDPYLEVTLNHATRAHMDSDLARYFFSSTFRGKMGRPAKVKDFPSGLAPEHANWKSGNFVDRFRAQAWGEPSTTITSHIAKDGHYFIHPDPQQCRSLTVREAARLQTFPDNYLFLGNTTQQYVQVGNAVPPFLARQIAGALDHLLSREAS